MQAGHPATDVVSRVDFCQTIRMSGHEAYRDHLQLREAVPINVLQHFPLDELARLQGHVVISQHERKATDGRSDDGENLGEAVARAIDQRDFVADGVEEVGEETYPQ